MKTPRIATVTRLVARELGRLSGAEQRLVREAIRQPLPLQRLEPWQTRPGLYRARVGELRLMLRLEPDDTFCALFVGRHNAADRFAQDYRPSRNVQAIPLEEVPMMRKNASNNNGAGAVQSVPAATPEPTVPFPELKALYDGVSAVVRAETAQSDGMLLEHRDALDATARTLEDLGARLAGVAETTHRLERDQEQAMFLALDAGLAPVIAQVAELRNDLATASNRANGHDKEHRTERAQLRSELDGLRDALLGMTDALAERAAEMSARNDVAASTLRDEFNGRIGGLSDELTARIENGLGRLDRLAGDVARMREELRAEVASLAALFETTRAELKRRNGRSWAGRRARMYERIRRGWHAVVTGFLSHCRAPRPAADRPSRPMQALNQ